MRRIKCTVMYDGTAYYGYQTQLNLDTIQERIEFALSRIHRKKMTITSSSRTDRGVHARCQVFHFDTDMKIKDDLFKRALNSFLPNDIRIVKSELVADDFHSRYYVKDKTYKYYITKTYDPNTYRYAKMVQLPLNLEKMDSEIKKLIGEHNFRSFTSRTKYDNYVREILDAKVYEKDDMIIIEITGKGFLRYMVRIIAGTLIDIGLGKKDNIMDILAKEDRFYASRTADAKGLFLENINYWEKL